VTTGDQVEPRYASRTAYAEVLASPDAARPALRLGYALPAPEEIVEGVARLGALLTELTRRP